jgi:hypothetical protein
MEELVMKTLVMNENEIEMKNFTTEPGSLKIKKFDIDSYLVVHPLFDTPEKKVDTDIAKPLKMSKTVKWSLISLRVYLIIMIGLAFYRVMVLAGIF